jgi:glyoxalase superfamily protein
VIGVYSYIKNATFDCEDALRVARFWAAALGTDVDEGSTSQKAYLERFEDITVMRDPEGNEFCVEPGAATRR